MIVGKSARTFFDEQRLRTVLVICCQRRESSPGFDVVHQVMDAHFVRFTANQCAAHTTDGILCIRTELVAFYPFSAGDVVSHRVSCRVVDVDVLVVKRLPVDGLEQRIDGLEVVRRKLSI